MFCFKNRQILLQKGSILVFAFMYGRQKFFFSKVTRKNVGSLPNLIGGNTAFCIDIDNFRCRFIFLCSL
jgi:hypothetical protein